MNTSQKSEIKLAVLPFEILVDSGKIHPVVAGFTEDLIAQFSRFKGLSVISHLSTRKISDPTDSESVNALGADYLITGSFRTLNDNIRIGIQLVRTPDFTIVFADQVESTLNLILEAQDDIVRRITNILQQYIDTDILADSIEKDTYQLAAYEHWLIGMEFLRKGTHDNDLNARKHFEAALKIDPSFSRAYTGISLSYFNEWSCQLWDRWEVSKQGARKYAQKALDLDNNDYVSLAVLGRTYLYAGEYDKAEHCLKRSLQINPNDAQNLLRVAFSFMFLGQPEEAIALYHKATNLNPLHSEDYFTYGSSFYFEAGDYNMALELGNKVPLEKTWVDFSVYLAATYYYLDDKEGAHAMWEYYLDRFSKMIIKGKSTDPSKALTWHMNVNPYKDGKTKLKDFWEYISSEKNISVTKVKEAPPAQRQKGKFIHEGDFWEIEFMGSSLRMKDLKGLHDIVRLLSEPEKAFHCTELADVRVKEEAVDVVFDEKAKADYRSKLLSLQEDIEEAERMHNTALAEKLNMEYEALLGHLESSLGLGGKTRKVGSNTEKARSAVTWRIRSAISKIEVAHPALGKHLNTSIKTGTFCSYNPEYPVDWVIQY